MKIIFTKHAQNKFEDLRKLGVVISKKIVISTIKTPISIDKATDYPNLISTGFLDSTHVIRVVHRRANDIIIVITFYPAKKGRYKL